MGSEIQIWKSASSANDGLEAMLLFGGLESKIGSSELADAICENKSVALVEQLCEYAVKFPQSREFVIQALEMSGNCTCSRVISKAKRGVSEILALNMVEALY